MRLRNDDEDVDDGPFKRNQHALWLFENQTKKIKRNSSNKLQKLSILCCIVREKQTIVIESEKTRHIKEKLQTENRFFYGPARRALVDCGRLLPWSVYGMLVSRKLADCRLHPSHESQQSCNFLSSYQMLPTEVHTGRVRKEKLQVKFILISVHNIFISRICYKSLVISLLGTDFTTHFTFMQEQIAAVAGMATVGWKNNFSNSLQTLIIFLCIFFTKIH